jgi:hypothetical protein
MRILFHSYVLLYTRLSFTCLKVSACASSPQHVNLYVFVFASSTFLQSSSLNRYPKTVNNFIYFTSLGSRLPLFLLSLASPPLPYPSTLGRLTSRPYRRFVFLLGGASRTRTDHLLRARQALYQMSYDPFSFLLLPYRHGFSHLLGGSGWTRTTDLTLIRGAL